MHSALFLRGFVFHEGPAALAFLLAGTAVFAQPVAPLPEEKAAVAGLGWLLRHQDPDGRWSAGGFSERCTPGPAGPCAGAGVDEFELALTGLALQAVAGRAGSGAIPGPRPPTPAPDAALALGLQWVAEHLPEDLGAEGPRTWHYYNYAIGAAGLAAALERREDARGRAALEKAVRTILASQNPDGGWGSPSAGRRSDSSGTGWCLDALRAARRAKVEVPDAAFHRAREWFASVTGADGRVGYHQRGDRGFDFGDGGRFVRHDILTPTRFAVLPPEGAPTPRGERDAFRGLLDGDLPSADAEAADYLYWHQGTRALAADGTGSGIAARRWLRALGRASLRKQDRAPGTCVDGAWAPDDRWAVYGGRVYATALNVLTLERALPALRAGAAEETAPLSGAERDRLRGMVRRLGSDVYAEREAATRALEEAGDAAAPLLREAAQSEDAEVKTRARRVLERLGLEADEKSPHFPPRPQGE